MNKYIFLDIDGVLATPKCVTKGLWSLCDDKQELLGQILKATSAKIILSSSWRKHNLEETVSYMKEQGFWFCDDLIGVTIRGYQHVSKIHLSIPRGVEIKQWIDTNIHSNNGKDWNHLIVCVDYQYVIIDDDSDMLLEHKDNFIKTKSDIGLTEKDVLKAIKILNNEK